MCFIRRWVTVFASIWKLENVCHFSLKQVTEKCKHTQMAQQIRLRVTGPIAEYWAWQRDPVNRTNEKFKTLCVISADQIYPWDEWLGTCDTNQLRKKNKNYVKLPKREKTAQHKNNGRIFPVRILTTKVQVLIRCAHIFPKAIISTEE